LRVHSRRGIANGVVLVLVILVVAIPTSTYFLYFNKPITTAPTATETTSSSGSSGTSTTAASGPALGFVTGNAVCGFGLTYGSPGGEGCFVFVLNNGTSTLTATGTCNLTFGGSTYPGTFSYADQLGPGQSTGKITCGSASEDPPAGAGTKISGQVFFTNGQYVGYNGTAAS
jgi:hypothetical protein